MVDKTLYTKDSIESKDPREFVRLKPGVYCGDTTYCTQLVVELFSNSLDEHNLGHGNQINVTIEDSGWITVEDFAQGFPVNIYREDGKTILEAAFSVLNTSGKYREDGVYEGTSLGAYGIGSKLPTFLSTDTIVFTSNKGLYEEIHFKDGIFVSRNTGNSNKASGTKVKFNPDPQFFAHAKPNINELKKLFNDICCLCPKLSVNLTVNGKTETISHPNGIGDLVTQYIGKDSEIIKSRFNLQAKDGKRFLDMALTYSSSSSATIVPYVNYGLTEQGPHITTVKSSITKALNSWARENSMLKKNEDNLDGASLQEGLVVVFNLITTDVHYDAQVKSRVTNTDFVSFLNEAIGKKITAWLDNNPNDAKEIVEKALLAKRAAEAAKKAREAVKNKKTKAEKVFKLPTKLTDAWSKDRSKCELLIAEGLSAASGLVAARNGEFQAVYGVRGKMLSVLKSTPKAILANQEINNLIQALGLECNEKTAKLTYDPSRLRYGKIIACADADPDGKAIENLLFNILWYLCPELAINGHVYSSVPPLFRVTTKKNEYVYLKDEKALDQYKKSNSSKIASITRNKGLGEQDADELSYCLLNPETRNILQLAVPSVKRAENMFNDFYGKAVEPRVKYLLEHSEEASID